MPRLFLVAALLMLPAGIPTPAPSSAPPSWPIPIALSELDRQPRTGAALDPANPFCGSPDDVAASLVDDYGETVVASSGLPGDRLLELWASASAGSWTLVYHRPDGVACVADWGDGWSPLSGPHPLMVPPGVAA
ncbi:MAG TPA: hypothetical protein PKD10_07025 [Paracoccaceae bacterium]|nr:hypothetical protein [Paracoccaceae bacterium]HMO70983.1 hypothetical protein [Paracoccaceae bacterium]